MIFQDPRAGHQPDAHDRRPPDRVAAARARAGRRSRARARAVELLAAVRLPRPEDHLRQYPHELSGGMLQRVMIAGALTSSPASCWSATSRRRRSTSRRRPRSSRCSASCATTRGMGMLFITHDLNLAASLCDRVVVMRAGPVEEEGDAREVLRQPRRPSTPRASSRRRRRSRGARGRRRASAASSRARPTASRARCADLDGRRAKTYHRAGKPPVAAVVGRVARDPARRRARGRRGVGVGQVDARPHDRRPRAGRRRRHPHRRRASARRCRARGRSGSPTRAACRWCSRIRTSRSTRASPAGRAIEDALRLHTTALEPRMRAPRVLDAARVGRPRGEARRAHDRARCRAASVSGSRSPARSPSSPTCS